MAVRDAPLEPARCRAGRNRTSEAGDLGFPAGGGGFGIGEEGWEGHWEKRRRVRCEEKQPGDGDSGCPVGPPLTKIRTNESRLQSIQQRHTLETG